LWIVQEVGTAKSVLLSLGNITIEFGNLVTVAIRLYNQPFLKELFGLATDRAFKSFTFPARRKELQDDDDIVFDFLSILGATRTQLASDPRDYVCALLGHPSALLGGIPIVEPDYNKSASELFSEVLLS
jgi:hypothetical protein